MLLALTVSDFAIVDRLELQMRPGMTVLTGETGAGKSIMVDALGLVLGDRGSNTMVRPGRERAEVVAVFDVERLPAARAWLAGQEPDAAARSGESECILRRTVAADGRSRAWINDRPVPLQSLRELGELLVDIHRQHAHQSLLRRATQRQILDEIGRHAELLERLSGVHGRLEAAEEEIRKLGGEGERDGGRIETRLDLLRYQARELAALKLGPDEIGSIDEEHRRLAHAAELAAACRGVFERLEGDDASCVLPQMGAALHAIDGMLAFDARLGAVRELLDGARIQLEEAAAELRRYGDGLDLDPERYRWLDERLSAIHALARKHRVPPEELAGLLEDIEQEIEGLAHRGERVESLRVESRRLEREYRALARELGERREAAAAELSREVTADMQRLGMTGGRFEVATEHDAEGRPSPVGTDRIEFQVSAGPGQALQPLARVASGGELSRISLAIQVIASQGTGVPTLIFDEVDAGIGGRVAEIVGQRLRRLARRRQVLCVTHLPQVASQAEHHVHVRKVTARNSTRTCVEPLAGEERVAEVARMLGGVEITARTLAHAREMLARA